ncbi:MAG: 5-(carboxyamino)imidazole ribonucleotide synthase [Bacteroidota bacterium]|nr:5-(carboxyamino)imidazole ribonucleotide synthase [Bacteroidota bacterium]
MLPSPYDPTRVLTIGILGGGQLAKMTAMAAYRLGFRVAIIEHGEESPAGVMTKLDFPGGWTNADELDRFIRVSDIITLENEFIAPELLEHIAERRLVFPSPQTVAKVRDKYVQKQTMAAAGIDTPAFAAVASPADIAAFAAEHGYPVVVKTRTFGYDGYGNALVRSEHEIAGVWQRFTSGEHPRELMVEQFIRFRMELATIVARNQRGECVVYPCVQTIQENHICRVVLAPAPVEPSIAESARTLARRAVEAVNGVGVFGIEMFLTEEGKVLFNEIAPRPHNSGHYTIEACQTSQFENCVRAVCNLPLGAPDMIVPAAAMINLLGERNGSGIPDSPIDALRHGHAWIHLYGKKDCRVGRKMGHITAVGATLEEAFSRARAATEGFIW